MPSTQMQQVQVQPMPPTTVKPAKRQARRRNLFAAIVALLVAAALLIGGFIWLRPAPDPFAADAVTAKPFSPLTYSIQAFLWWDTGYTGLHLDWVNLLALNAVKQTFAWSNLEPEAGAWNFTEADRIMNEVERRDIQLIIRLGQVPQWATSVNLDDPEIIDAPPDDLTTWANYCRTLAERYTGRVKAYQIWNEPNLTREWGGAPPNAASYVQLLRLCSAAIRDADPDAILISSGLSPTGTQDERAHRDDIYLDAMYRAGFQQYIDVVGVHAPGWAHPPSYGPDDAERDGNPRWATFRRVEDLRKIMLQHDDAARQMAILEFGWTIDPLHPEYAWHAVTEQQQAQYIVDAYAYAAEHWRPWVGLMSLVYLPKQSWTQDNEQYWWALTTPEHRLREAFFAVASMPKYCDGYIIPARPPEHPEFDGDVPIRTCD